MKKKNWEQKFYELYDKITKENKIKLCFMEKHGIFPEGIYKFKEPNIWYPIVYFRKPKSVKEKEFRMIINYLKQL